MNDNQLGSLVLSLIKVLCAALAAHGFTTASTILGMPDVVQDLTGIIGVIIAMAMSHLHHGDSSQNSAPPPSSSGNKLPLVLMVASLTAAAFLSAGCQSAPGVVLKTVGTTDATAYAALHAWGDYVAANHPPVSQEIAVRAAYQKFQTAEELSLDVGKGLLSYTGTNAPAGLLAQSTAASQAETQALQELLTLLAQFGVKL